MSSEVQQAFHVLTDFQKTLKTLSERDFEGLEGDLGYSALPNG